MILRIVLLLWLSIASAHAQTFVYDGVVDSQVTGCGAHGGTGCGFSSCTGSCPATSYGCPATTATGVSGWGWKYDGTTQWCWHIATTCPTGQVFINGVCQTAPEPCDPPRELINGVCSCPNGQVWSELLNACATCPTGVSSGSGGNFTYPQGSTAPSSVCVGACLYSLRQSMTICFSGNCYSEVGNGLGQACTSATSTPQTPVVTPEEASSDTPEEACLKQGKGYITLNGVTTCSIATPQNPVTTTTTSSTTTTGATNATTTATTQTTDYGTYTQTSTTSTTTNGTGTSTTNSTSTDPKPPSSSVGGADDCNVAPACTGDAIQCAIIYKEWQQWCQVQSLNTSNDYSQAYEAATANVGTPNPITTPKSMTDFFSLTNHVSVGASCPSSITIPLLGGRSYILDLSYLCSYLGLIALIIKTLAWLFVGRITLEAL